MTDHSKCEGHGCPIKEFCKRYLTISRSAMQSYIEAKYDSEKGCGYFMEAKE